MMLHIVKCISRRLGPALRPGSVTQDVMGRRSALSPGVECGIWGVDSLLKPSYPLYLADPRCGYYGE